MLKKFDELMDPGEAVGGGEERGEHLIMKKLPSVSPPPPSPNPNTCLRHHHHLHTYRSNLVLVVLHNLKPARKEAR
jgi:hypothetical protein